MSQGGKSNGLFSSGSTSLYASLLPEFGLLNEINKSADGIRIRLSVLQEASAGEEREYRAEETMLSQVCAWLMLGGDGGAAIALEAEGGANGEEPPAPFEYRAELLGGLFALGKLYFEMGYLTPAEKIFSGLVVVDLNWQTPARLGLGLIRLEFGNLEEAGVQFRRALEVGTEGMASKLGLISVFVAQGEAARAQSLLNEVGRELESVPTNLVQQRLSPRRFALRYENTDQA